MRRSWLAAVFGLGGLSGISVVFAHAGVSVFGHGIWLAVAMVGGLVSAVGLALVGLRVVDLRRRLDRIGAGDLSAAPFGERGSGLPLSVLVSASLVCQGGAHVSLLLAGVHDHSGMIAAPALHVLLGFASALLVYGVDRLPARLASEIAEAACEVLRLLLAIIASPSARPAEVPRPRVALTAHQGRAPPLIA